MAVDGGETENGYVGCCYWSQWEWRWSLNCGTAVTTGGQGEGYPDRNSVVANCFLLWFEPSGAGDRDCLVGDCGLRDRDGPAT